MTELSIRNIGLVFLDSKMNPISILYPQYFNKSQRAVQMAQIKCPEDRLLKIQKQIIKLKLLGQREVLLSRTLDLGPYIEIDDRLQFEQDPIKVEAVLASHYWRHLLDGGTRRQESELNKVLNYGYAITRSLIARQMTASGLNLVLGHAHSSLENMFGLVDDLHEILRPIVDYFCFNYLQVEREDWKQQVVQILNTKINMEKNDCSLNTYAQKVVRTYINLLEGKEGEFENIWDSNKIYFPAIE